MGLGKYRMRVRALVSVVLIGLSSPSQAGTDRPTLSSDAYAAAERLSPQNADALAYDLDLRPTWIKGSNALWYKTRDALGTTYRIAEPDLRRTRPAFDHARMAQALGRALKAPLTPGNLSITDLAFPAGTDGPVQVQAAGKSLSCDLGAAICTPVPVANPAWRYSPDGQLAVFARGANLWVRDVRAGTERGLTSDGAEHKGYGALSETFAAVTVARMGLKGPPIGAFSPDGTKFLTYQLDESSVEPLHLLQNLPEDGSDAPKLWSYRSPAHSAGPAVGNLLVIDLKSGRMVRLAHPPSFVRIVWPVALEQFAWSADSRSVYFVDYTRDLLEKSLYRANVATGKVARLISERAATSQLNSNLPNFRLLQTGEILWPSERDGYAHLYMLRPDGRLAHRLTSGQNVVREIVRVDQAGRTADVLIGGLHSAEDPYLRHLCRVSLNGSRVQELTPEDADHEIATLARAVPFQFDPSSYGGFSEDGRWFVDAYSRVDLPTTTVIRDGGGKVAMTLATARLTEKGRAAYKPPESFKVMAEDGRTPLYGIIMKPTAFDPARSYPVIDSEYDGPQAATAPKRYLWDVLTGFHSSRPLAELGFVVVNMDARGKPWRSRAFWDYGYGHLGRGGLPDRVAMLRQLGAVHPYMDLTRVGVYGYSGGGFAAVHAIMDQPDVYKVAVAVSPYSLMYSPWNWDQTWHGVYDRAGDLAQEPWANAPQFKGKLLMMVGDVDDVVHPATIMRIADALIKNNKTFDMLVVPNGDHQMILKPYFQQRVWDYFVRQLLGAEPPPGYVVGASKQPS